MRIIQVAVPVPLKQFFDYLPLDEEHELVPGMRVLVSFGRRKLVGFVWDIKSQSKFHDKLKPILSVIDNEPVLDKKLLQLCEWLSSYYHYPIGEVCATVLPNLLRQDKSLKKKLIVEDKKNQTTSLKLNAEQTFAVEKITAAFNQFQTFLLEGVTASGKTEVYLQVIEKIIAANQQALVLVPEISLTPQTVKRFAERFPGRCAALHSGLTERERLQIWFATKNNEIDIIIGTRSAIFTPLAKPGIIIIDEEHDLSFKQQDGLRYSARDVAVRRGQFENIPVVLASATPSLESLNNAENKRYVHLQLTQRANQVALPHFKVIDLRHQYLEHGLSNELIKKIKTHLENNQQALLFLNRRGYAPVLMCHQCGWIGKCTRCELPFTYHQEKNNLICHHCEKTMKKPSVCPACKQAGITPVGMGTERVEETLKNYFPEVDVVRVDRDSTRKKNQLQEILDLVNTGKPMILIGTQMLAKGHHFPKVTLVGIVNPDQGFFSSDFRAMERMGQLITQVAGRAGRDKQKGEVVIQTHQPEHPLLVTLLKQGYSVFAQALLKERQLCYLPPFVFFALLRAEAYDQQQVENFLQALKEKFSRVSEVNLLGPVNAPMAKKAGKYRMQILFSSRARKTLHELLSEIENYLSERKLSKIRWSIDVDPQDMF